MRNGGIFKNTFLLSAGLTFMGGLGACSTTSKVIKTSSSAPITYKVGKGAVKYASVTMPSRPTYKAAPSAPVYTAPVPRTPKFDQSTVDRDLYAHQRVGKKYKIAGKSYKPKHEPDYDETGTASWYGDKFHGKPTATGEIYNKHDITAAHKTLPLNSMVFVTNIESGQALLIRVNDRGPFIGKRIIDLSEASANALGIKHSGLGKVRVQYAGPADPMASGYRSRHVPAPTPELTVRAPEYSAPTPMPAPSYTPLRELPQATSPREAQNLPTPTPRATQDYQSVPAPIAPRPAEPVAPSEAEDEGITTLTIKGPVHMASMQPADAAPRFIPAVNYRTYKTNK